MSARLPPETAVALRPALPGLAEEIIEGIRKEVPEYARELRGAFGHNVRTGVEVALRRFVDAIEHPGEPPAARGRDVYVALGAGEAREGRSLDALLAAYRVGARISWRRLVDAGVAGGLAPETLYALGETIFAYIDEISAESVDGYAVEQSRAAGEHDRRRRSLARLLGAEPPAAPEQVRAEAERAGWRLPERLLALVAPADVARRLPPDCLVLTEEAEVVAFVPDPDGPGRRAELSRAAPAALGPAVHWSQAGRSLARARSVRALQAAGSLDPEAAVAADQHLDALVVHAAPEIAAELRDRLLAPLEAERPSSRSRLLDTLCAWVDEPGQPLRIAHRLGVHPQTVRYRVRRLRELLGDEALDDPDARFALALVFRVRAAG
jgi:PucR-like helix-turn-helix protein